MHSDLHWYLALLVVVRLLLLTAAPAPAPFPRAGARRGVCAADGQLIGRPEVARPWEPDR